MNICFRLGLILLIAGLLSCCKSQKIPDIYFETINSLMLQEDFESKKRFSSVWENDSHNGLDSYKLEKKHLKITTRATSKDRVKVATKRKDYGVGIYTWQIYIPKFSPNDRCSVGAFIYHSSDTEYEFDFEIGSGKQKIREELNAEENEAVVYCTSQKSPHNSSRFLVKMDAYSEFKLKLSLVKNAYLVEWYLNGKQLKTLQTEVPGSVKFSIYASLENLTFMGNHLPEHENSVLFDRITFQHE